MSVDEGGAKGEHSAPEPGRLIRSEEYTLIHNSEALPDPHNVIHIPCSDMFSVIVQLRDFTSHRLWNGNKLVFDGGHPQKSISIAYLGDEIKCQHRASYDNVRFMLPRTSIKDFLYEEGLRTSAEPERIIGVNNPVVYHLAMALMPSFARPEKRNDMFIEQVILALLTHLHDRFAPPPVQTCTSKGLAPWQLRKAKELIAGHLIEGVSVARLAEECGLSRSYFTKAFKGSTGLSPHEWLMHMRVDRAKDLMLRSDESLSQISLACGFSDQAHFSRVFLRLTKASPSAWRRVKRQCIGTIE
ncbi:helix-turn-helix domain-containing protein [Pseudomonas aeruginosa]|uniref:helix-turn-helix domain-containing protein n=1 Tax=Pseudomonas aeruginosa TaxID=287 RepID=UPI000FC430AF|nr:AraC family transcriptional regulator [Pseudomonas aeruginosa]RUI22463.1 AraC family transcriptional regulator [Pseudomonas aeruginosa]